MSFVQFEMYVLVHECGENEVYRDSGRDCQRCEDDHDRDCPLIHESRCYCKDGYIRNKEGRCVNAMSCQSRSKLQFKRFDLFYLIILYFRAVLPSRSQLWI